MGINSSIGAVSGIALSSASSYVNMILIADVNASSLRVISCVDPSAVLVNGYCEAPTSSPTMSPTTAPVSYYISDSYVDTVTGIDYYDDTSSSYVSLEFSQVFDIAVSQQYDSRILVTDYGLSSVYVIDSVTKVATMPFTQAVFLRPSFIDVDASDNVYVMDDNGLRLFMHNQGDSYDPAGLTIFSYTGFTGIAAVPSYSASFSNSVAVYSLYSGGVYLVTYNYMDASLELQYLTYIYGSYSLVLDSTQTNLFVTSSDYAIYRMNLVSYEVDLYAGTSYSLGYDDGPRLGSATFDGGNLMLSMDGEDNIYITSSASYAIRFISAVTGTVSTLAGQKCK